MPKGLPSAEQSSLLMVAVLVLGKVAATYFLKNPGARQTTKEGLEFLRRALEL